MSTNNRNSIYPKENRWISVQRGLQRWDKIMTIVFSVLLLLLLLAILVVNIMHGARKEADRLKNENTTIKQNFNFDQSATQPMHQRIVPIQSSSSVSTRDTATVHCHSDNDSSSVQFIELTVRRRAIDIVKIGNGSIQIDINIQNYSQNSALLWFNGNRSVSSINFVAEFSCLNVKADSIFVTNITAESVYTICLIDKTNVWISPFECVTYYERMQRDEQDVWLTDDTKMFWIGLIIFGLLFMMFLGIAVCYVIVRHYPILMRRCRRVVVVEDESKAAAKANVLVMPREWLVSTEYLLRGQPYRKISTISDYSGKLYERTQYLSRFEVVEWELEQAIQRREQNQHSNVYAPPLPPRRANKKLKEQNVNTEAQNESSLTNYI